MGDVYQGDVYMGDVYKENVYNGDVHKGDAFNLKGDVHRRRGGAGESSKGRRRDSLTRLGHRAAKTWPQPSSCCL